MATAMRETERKYEAPPGAPLPDLRDLPQVAAQTDAQDVTLDATYHDTESFDLVRAGITLRRRTGGSDAGWHLKIPAGPDSRTELRLPLGDELPPEEFTDLLTARTRGRPLHPVAMITTTRRVTTLTDAEGDPLAEVALDRITAAKLGHVTSLTHWSEVEFELAEGVDGAGRLLKAADRSLRRAGLRRAQRGTKLEAALADALPATAPQIVEVSKASSASDVLADYLRRQFDELRRQDLRVRRDEPEAVHDMRVAARRLRAVLQNFTKLYRPGSADRLIRELRWLGRELGKPRDAEVLGDLLIAQLRRVPRESVMGPVRARIAGHYAHSLAVGTTSARAALASVRYLGLLESLDAFIEHPPAEKAAHEPALDVLPRLVNRSRRRVKRRMRRAVGLPPGIQRDTALHEARKAAKRARYAAESVADVQGKKARKTAKAMKRVQTALGDQHDAVIAAGELRHLAIRAHRDGETTYTYGLLHERQSRRAERFEERARRACKRAE